jgi:hypothetical protein
MKLDFRAISQKQQSTEHMSELGHIMPTHTGSKSTSLSSFSLPDPSC